MEMELSTVLIWTCRPNVRQKDDGLWYPSVIFEFQGQREREMQFDIPFATEVRAWKQAGVLAHQEAEITRRSLEREMEMLRA